MKRVIDDIDADVCAIGEVNDVAALGALAREIGPTWTSVATSAKVGRTPQSREYYGWIWDSRRLDRVAGASIDPDPPDDIDRDPAWVTFRTRDGRLDFTVLAVHITFGSGVAVRRAEVRAMADVWRRTQTATVGDDDVILVGDFNRPVGDASFGPLLAIPTVCANSGTGPTVTRGSSTYDQFYLSRAATAEWTGGFGTFDFDDAHFGGNDAKAEKDVSDHRPIWIALKIPARDDD